MIVVDNPPVKNIATYPQGPPPPPYPSSRRPARPELPLASVSHRESAVKRFIKSLAVALSICFLLGLLTGTTVDVTWNRNHSPRWFAAGWHDSVDDWPIPPDIHTRQCAQRGDWSDDIPSAVYPYSSSVSFELPLSSPALLLLARGSLGTGAVQISQITQPGDIAEVRVNVGYYLADAIDRARVCAITREVGGDGVGIFTPSRSRRRSPKDLLYFHVTVLLPSSVGDSPLFIQNFTTDLPNFSHQVGQLRGAVHFGAISLRGSNKFIAAESLVAESAELKTSNAPIDGSFNTSGSLFLVTSNAHVRADVGLQSTSMDKTTHVTIKTSNAWIRSNISLLSPNTTGGHYSVSAQTSNGALDLDFPLSPVDSTLRLDGATSNAPVAVALHSAYEGAFSLRSSLFTPTLKERDVEDPSGRGRPRDVEIRRMGRGYIEGRVRYDPPGVAGGWVELKTSNARAGLTL